MLVKVGEVLEFGEDILCSGKGFRLTPLPLLSFLPSCMCGKERRESKIRVQERRLITGQRYSFWSVELNSREIELSQRSASCFPTLLRF